MEMRCKDEKKIPQARVEIIAKLNSVFNDYFCSYLFVSTFTVRSRNKGKSDKIVFAVSQPVCFDFVIRMIWKKCTHRRLKHAYLRSAKGAVTRLMFRLIKNNVSTSLQYILDVLKVCAANNTTYFLSVINHHRRSRFDLKSFLKPLIVVQ